MLTLKSVEAIGTVEGQDLVEHSKAMVAPLDRSYHYGVSASNIEFPEGDLSRIALKVGRGNYSGVGTITDKLDETTLLNARRIKAQTAIVGDLLDALHDHNPEYKVTKVVTLFSPVKLFVVMSNGNEAEDVVYMSINGRSNGSGQRKEVNWPKGLPMLSRKKRKALASERIIEQRDNLTDYTAKLERIKNGTAETTWDGQQGHYESMIESFKGNIQRLEKILAE